MILQVFFRDFQRFLNCMVGITFRAIAASAPIWQFTGLTPCDAFNRVVTADYATVSAGN